jgi:hypothetical protein|eukprot:COSAG01_NODE_15938_length_1284_cov_58.007595_3_plen_77_part_00
MSNVGWRAAYVRAYSCTAYKILTRPRSSATGSRKWLSSQRWGDCKAIAMPISSVSQMGQRSILRSHSAPKETVVGF